MVKKRCRHKALEDEAAVDTGFGGKRCNCNPLPPPFHQLICVQIFNDDIYVILALVYFIMVIHG
jgi:hypothetical protein